MQRSLLDGIIWLLFLGGLVGFAMALIKLFGGGTLEEYGVLGVKLPKLSPYGACSGIPDRVVGNTLPILPLIRNTDIWARVTGSFGQNLDWGSKVALQPLVIPRRSQFGFRMRR